MDRNDLHHVSHFCLSLTPIIIVNIKYLIINKANRFLRSWLAIRWSSNAGVTECGIRYLVHNILITTLRMTALKDYTNGWPPKMVGILWYWWFGSIMLQCYFIMPHSVGLLVAQMYQKCSRLSSLFNRIFKKPGLNGISGKVAVNVHVHGIKKWIHY